MKRKALRSVTCPGCQTKFKPCRSDKVHCSDTCRQRTHRAKADIDELDREIELTRKRYWKLIAQKAQALQADRSQVVTAESQLVDVDGNVSIRGKIVGKVKPQREGWAAWGLEAAGPPFSPPEFNLVKERRDRNENRRRR